MPGSSFVKFCNVQKTYDGETLVVKNLDLGIGKGEFLTMLGPSGSGKTTTLMMLAGFEAPTHGSILLAGRSIDKMPPHKRDIGMVFQNYALFPHMTVQENLAFPLKVRKIGKAETEERIKRVLEMVRLGAYGGRRPGQLSGGQQQRVALARALVFDPKLVLMDEPLGALDKQLREHMQLEIKHIHETLGITVVYVTHDQIEALTMSDRIAVFNEGVIQQLAAPGELYERASKCFCRPIRRREQPIAWPSRGDEWRRVYGGDCWRWQRAGARRQCRGDRSADGAVVAARAREVESDTRVVAQCLQRKGCGDHLSRRPPAGAAFGLWQ
ncbi:ABC-type Fe3+/spermidine/putrescine transport system ATPase subunit [Bradyrhizobium sp. LM2.9]